MEHSITSPNSSKYERRVSSVVSRFKAPTNSLGCCPSSEAGGESGGEGELEEAPVAFSAALSSSGCRLRLEGTGMVVADNHLKRWGVLAIGENLECR